MLIVRVYMKRKGVGQERLMSEAHIWNDCTGDGSHGNYKAQIFQTIFNAPFIPRAWKESAVQDFPRQRLGVWDLLYRVLDGAVGFRNKKILPAPAANQQLDQVE